MGKLAQLWDKMGKLGRDELAHVDVPLGLKVYSSRCQALADAVDESLQTTCSNANGLCVLELGWAESKHSTMLLDVTDRKG